MLVNFRSQPGNIFGRNIGRVRQHNIKWCLDALRPPCTNEFCPIGQTKRQSIAPGAGNRLRIDIGPHSIRGRQPMQYRQQQAAGPSADIQNSEITSRPFCNVQRDLYNSFAIRPGVQGRLDDLELQTKEFALSQNSRNWLPRKPTDDHFSKNSDHVHCEE